MVGGIGGPGGSGKVGGPGVPAPTSPVKSNEATGGTFKQAVSASTNAGSTNAASPLERLRSGEIDLAKYTELRVTDATAHLEGILPPADLEKVREELHALIENDPDVAALVKGAEIGS